MAYYSTPLAARHGRATGGFSFYASHFLLELCFSFLSLAPDGWFFLSSFLSFFPFLVVAARPGPRCPPRGIMQRITEKSKQANDHQKSTQALLLTPPARARLLDDYAPPPPPHTRPTVNSLVGFALCFESDPTLERALALIRCSDKFVWKPDRSNCIN